MTNRLVIAFLCVVVVACSESHTGGPDATPIDSGAADAALDVTATQDGRVDADCPDSDGDGFRAAACGGDDCDDTRREINPSAQRCAGPTAVERCAGGVLQVTACGPDLPDCDARTNSCAESACGDLVVHPDEQCDRAPGEMCSMCQQRCVDSSGCSEIAGAPNCVATGPFADGACRPPGPGGLPMGSVCMDDAQCESSYCEPTTRRCTTLCQDVGACSPFHSATWCSRSQVLAFTPGGPASAFPNYCSFRCGLDSDCQGGDRCTVVMISPDDASEAITATCLPVAVPGLPAGAACGEGVVGGCDANNCVGRTCTTTCVGDDDCLPPFTRCTDYDFHGERPGTPWVTPWPMPRVCVL